MKRWVFVLAVVPLAACSTATHIQGANGEPLVLIACGAATPSSVCYDRARKECPGGYKEVEHDSGFNRQELRVQCLK